VAIPGARVKVGFGGSSEKYVLVLAGEDGRALAEHGAIVERELRSIPGIGNVTSSSSLVRPELVVRPDFARAADLGVTSAAIADTLRVATAGDYEQALAKLNLAQRQVPVVVRCGRRAGRPRTAVAPARARRTRAGAAGQRGHPHIEPAARHRSTATTASATSTSRSSSTSSRWATWSSRHSRCRA
jgi:hypothetical protein